MAEIAPYGSWPTPLSPLSLAMGGVKIGAVVPDGDVLWWSQSCPSEGGRKAVYFLDGDGHPQEATPPGADVGTRAHSYGGGSWWAQNGVLVYSDDSDGRLRMLRPPGKAPVLLTPDVAHRYADGRFSACGEWFVCVRERPFGSPGFPLDRTEDVSDIVCVRLGASEDLVTVIEGADFYACPRLSPCGRYILWLQWEHPNMPWDGTELWLGAFSPPAVSGARKIAGGPEEWIFNPSWSSAGDLLWVSDEGGWSQLRGIRAEEVDSVLNEQAQRHDRSEDRAITECGRAKEAQTWIEVTEGEIQVPNWVFGMSRHAAWPATDGSGEILACAIARPGGDLLKFYRLAAGQAPSAGYEEFAAYDGHTEFSSVCSWKGGVAAVAASWSDTNEILHVAVEDEGAYGASPVGVADARSNSCAGAQRRHLSSARVLHRPGELSLSSGYAPAPEHITFRAGKGVAAHALYYQPANPSRVGPCGERPPLVVMAHGGPTGAARTSVNLLARAWTSRGVAVVDVNYRGSTGYGREFRKALEGGWGDKDVIDCCAAARYLADRGDVDPDRIAFAGSSAGGLTLLLALTSSDLFSAGMIRYGVIDLESLAVETHKFESRYLDGLVGPYPAQRAVYQERSPIHRIHAINCPLLVMHGGQDLVVPIAQAESLVKELERRRLQYAYVVFPEERHGFRSTDSAAAAAEAEVSFLSQVFDFEAHGLSRHVEIRNSSG